MFTKKNLILFVFFWTQISFGVDKCSEIFNIRLSPITDINNLPKQDLITFLSKETYRGDTLENHPWNGIELTNPQAHKVNDFKYVIHAIKRGGPEDLPVEGSTQFISGSLISNDYVKAFGRFGYILDVKSENIIATWVVDGETTRTNPWEYRKTQGVYSPDDVLQRSGWFWQNHGQLLKVDIYNEVLLDSGSKSNQIPHKVKIIGLYVITDGAGRATSNNLLFDPVALGWDGPPLTELDILAAEKLAQKYKIPLIKIERNSPPVFIDRR